MLLAAPLAQAKVTLPLMFSDGAVVQRDRPLPVWGWATPGAKIEVAFDGRSAKVTADRDGAWRVELPAHAAGGPFVLNVREGDGDTVAVRDVLVGDVWLASGQSNMEWPVEQAQDAEQEIARANDSRIRHFKVPRSWSSKPEARLTGGQWRAASPQTVGQFSAVAYYFARELRANSDVPIGIVDSTWGGSSIEAWMDASSQGVDAATTAAKLRDVRAADDRALASTRQRMARWPEGADDASWKDVDVDDRDWDAMPVPGLWETSGYTGMDGVAWYRTTFELSAEEAAAGVVLGLGMIDDSDEAWVNGQPVGGLKNRWNTPREYRIAPQALRKGINHLAVRVTDTGGGGGIHGDAGLVYVHPQGAARRALPASWKFRPATVTVAMQDDKNQIATLLFNQMIHPLQPYPLRGVIWYQGEANASAELAYRYRDQFATMIRAWRNDWTQPELPFLWAQLANFRSGGDTATHSPWAMLRESQSRALALPATAQVVTIDIGNPTDIHPLNKQEVGRRLALAARHVTYGESLVHSGPVYRTAKFGRGSVRIKFDMQGSALTTRGNQAVQGFEVAGDDHHFHPAIAVIKGNRVVVSSDAVARPRAVRYAWSDNPEQANLANREGLPASPFRTDDWQ
ncbi:sialate O-acetylesterase [Lysobacter sp. CFH 32150]|uniref:sialate O-acetylesterase n=1 Tax=Lysobacter sp. CFH 32150 TaxID=2927128 RepID=UPI001FA73F24|nr:sialate O-acetylesterase [Lysobacter sp. CFH 32150]MCI4566362.1 beta galactosidase jelly roll domain-containing protein [Lysobacter sp. CFH 32150]